LLPSVGIFNRHSFDVETRLKAMKFNVNSLKFIDLFSGCGGFSHGLEMAGHRCLLGVDFNADAIESFKHNHPHAKTFLGDIKTLKSSQLQKMLNGQKVDMVVGGPPCQGFSTVGKGEAHDERNQLFKEFVRVVKQLEPKVVLFENVTGLVAKKNEKILKNIFTLFEKLGYSMDAMILNSEEFGVPEKRRRTIIMGVKGGEGLFPSPTHGESRKKLVTVAEVFKNLKNKRGEIFNHDVSLAEIKKIEDRERLKFIPPGCGIRYKNDEKKYLPKKLWYDVDWSKLKENRFRQTRLQRLPLDQPSPTILTARTSYYHPRENRYLTPREAAACQSFPNDFKFFGSQTSVFRQIGNAVPPLMAKSIGESLKKIDFNLKKTKKKNLPKLISKQAFFYKKSSPNARTH